MEILGTYLITYPKYGVQQTKNLVSHERWKELVKMVDDKVHPKDVIKKTFGESFFTDKSPLGEALISGKLVLPDWFKHNDALTKANYAAVAHQHNPDLVVDIIKEQTGADHVVLAFSTDYNSSNWSYIDHDSTGVCPSSREELRNFIFNKNSWLFGGNDNARPAPNFYDVPTYYKDGSVKEVKYTHKLVVDGFDKVGEIC